MGLINNKQPGQKNSWVRKKMGLVEEPDEYVADKESALTGGFGEEEEEEESEDAE